MTFHGKTHTNGFPLNGSNANIKSLSVRRASFKIQRLQAGVFYVDSLNNIVSTAKKPFPSTFDSRSVVAVNYDGIRSLSECIYRLGF